LRKVLSQGLLIPLETFGAKIEGDNVTIKDQEFKLSDDLSEIFNVIKYDPPLPTELEGKVKGRFPYFISKTDQERAQNIVDSIFIDHKHDEYEITQKCDGTSLTVYKKESEIGICSRNLELFIEGNEHLTQIRYMINNKIFDKIKNQSRNIAIQGEFCGSKIQSNYEKLKEHKFFIFDVFDIDNARYMLSQERKQFLTDLGLIQFHIPVYYENVKICIMDSIDDLLSFTEAQKSLTNSENIEGLVFKSCNSDFSFKVISNKYLLNEKS
jgi:RNA ligase (TIGR02306 family)